MGDLSHALPQELLVMLPESRMLTQLQTLERRIDSTILKKKARARDSLAEYPSMLLNIATTVSFSVTTASASPEGKLKAAFSQKDRYLCLRIYGAIVDPETEGKVDSDEFEGFCQFFKRIVVVFEKDVFPKGEDVIEWVKTDGNCDANGLEIKRKIPSSFKAKNVSARIFFVVDHYPEKFCCSETLDPLESFFGLDFKAVTRSALLRSLWQYIKTRSLLDSDSPLIIHCDEVLQSVFSCDQMFISDIVPKLQDMLEPCQPIEMSFDMVLADETGAQSLDITVEAQAPVDSNFAGWYEKLPDYGSEITQLNESVCTVSLY